MSNKSMNDPLHPRPSRLASLAPQDEGEGARRSNTLEGEGQLRLSSPHGEVRNGAKRNEASNHEGAWLRFKRAKTLRKNFAYHGAGLAIALFFLAPLAVTLLASFRHGTEARQPAIPPWPTNGFSLDSYRSLDSFGAGVWQHTVNSLAVSLATVVLTVAVSLLAGYGFSRYRFPLKNVLFVLVIATLMIPFQSILTPLFIILAKLGLNNSLVGLTLVYVTLQLPFSVFMMRNAFDAVPKEIEEAARIDGARDLMLLVRVLLPLVLPGVATVAIFAFLNAWNEFLAALVLLSSNEKYTLPVLMMAVRAGRLGAINWGAVQAGVAVMTIPCLIVFLALQRYYMRGLMAGAVK